MTEHDMSGHCGAIIHVDGYTRNGNEVNRPQVAPGRNDWARKILKEIPITDGWHFKD